MNECEQEKEGLWQPRCSAALSKLFRELIKPLSNEPQCPSTVSLLCSFHFINETQGFD